MNVRREARAAAAAGTGPDAAAAVQAALNQVHARLGGAPVTLAMIFLGGAYVDAAEQVSAVVAESLAPDVLLGVTAQGVIADGAEIEHAASVSLWAAVLPGTACTPLRYPPAASESTTGSSWPDVPADARGVIVLADPFSFPADGFLSWLAQARPGLAVSGGLASGARREGGNRLLLSEEVFTDGAVGVALGGNVRLDTLVSQGCRPVGPSYVITDAQRNIIVELGGRPAVERVQQIYQEATEADQQRMRAGLHIGLVINEYADEHRAGDFLVRGVLGADQERGALAVGDLVHTGQSVRFHVRDAQSADEELRRLLDQRPPGARPDAALLFTCNGRGSRLFGHADHDAELVRAALDEAPLAGFFAAGELGSVGGRGHLHGFTASLLTLTADGAP